MEVRAVISGEWSRILRHHYGMRWSARTTRVKHHGEHHFVRTLRRRYVLSRYGFSTEVPHYRHQFHIMTALREAGFVLACPPVDTVSGDPAVERADDYWILRAFTPHDGFESWHDERTVISSARTLAALHETGVHCPAPVIGPADASDALNWSVVRVMDSFDLLLARSGHERLPEDDRREFRTAVETLRATAAEVLPSAEEAGLSGVTHGDYRPANVLVRGREVVNVLDWERSRHDHHLHDAAFAALQFMVTCPCPCRRTGDVAATRLFMREYLTARRVRLPETVAWMLGFVVVRRMLLNGRTPERVRLFRSLGRTGLTDPHSWK
ncbi:aminoglycoside phosphotransferase family protein [Actinomadura sp. NTSP31]|uniref:aminoglycoside phosphotransferase family protein n=1 Tax=Actinomadura sp. NTSP31 TaxID=1735447 RepID=UPI0035BF2AE4